MSSSMTNHIFDKAVYPEQHSAFRTMNLNIKTMSRFLNMLTEKEQLQLQGWNDTQADFPSDKTIIELFEEQVAKTPDNIAVIFGERQLTYAQINGKANQLGHYLRAACTIQPDDIIALQLERSEWMIIAILGVMKSGAAYLPIAPDTPVARTRYMLSDSKAKGLLTDGATYGNARELEAILPVLNVEELKEQQQSNPVGITNSKNLAYIIYTSGSTGQPKGVMIEHQGIVNRLNWMQNAYPIGGTDCILQKTPYTFDVSVWELLWWSLQGAKVALLAPGEEKEPAIIIEAIEKHGVTTMHFVPSMLNAFLGYLEQFPINGETKSLRQVFTSGEALGATQIRQFFDRIGNDQTALHNLYGPTEASIDVSYYDCRDLGSQAIVPIGKPIDNIQLHIINENKELVPIGNIGELCISGTGLARGYLNNPELTTQKFMPHPTVPGGKLYKTGDLARWLPDGNIEFLGRIDHQLKIRGYRIEAGEIEQILLSHPDIQSTVVIGYDFEGNKELVAYLVAGENTVLPTNAALRSFLGKTLPAYMIPAYFVKLESMPLTSSGKANRKALPAPDTTSVTSGVSYVAPRNPVEQQLTDAWTTVLKLDKIGIHDDFLTIGGHSLRAIQLLFLIQQQLLVKLKLNDIFTNPTIAGLAVVVEQQKDKPVALQPIPLAETSDYYAISNAQKRLWVLDQFENGLTAYNMPTSIRIHGKLDIPALEAALNLLFQRHESLRTHLKTIDGQARQVILDTVKVKLETIDSTNLTQEKITAKIQENVSAIFNLNKGPLIKTELLECEKEDYILLFNMHHIISDGWSMNVLFKDLGTLYDACATRHPIPLSTLPTLPIQYKDYVAWQASSLDSKETTGNLKHYWTTQLTAGEEGFPTLELPADYPRPSIKTYNGASMHTVFNAGQLKGFQQLSQLRGTTLFMGLTALINILLHKYSHQRDIIIGSPVAGRNHPDLQNQIGFYANTIALRNQISEKDTFLSFLEKIKNTTVTAFEHDSYPFDQLVEDLNISRDLSRSPLFDVFLALHNNEQTDLRLGNLEVEQVAVETGTSRFDLTFDFTEKAEGLTLDINYNTDLFRPDRIQRLITHLEILIQNIITDPQQSIDQLQLLPTAEKHQLLEDFNNTNINSPLDKTFTDLFEEQARKTPGNTAIVFEDRQLTYQQLNEKANQVGHYLRENFEIKADDIVVLQLDRSEWMLIAILGVMKSGAAYLPVSPDFPKSRVAYILQDSQAKVLITDESTYPAAKALADILPQTKKAVQPVLSIEKITGTKRSDPVSINTSKNLAYTIYTSGSTGQPKGVLIEHQALVNFLWSMGQAPGLEEEDVLLSITNYTFDISILELGLPLIKGAKLVLASSIQQHNPDLLQILIEKTKPSFLQATPSLWSILINAKVKGLSQMKLLCGGEALPEQLAVKLLAAGKEVWNMYGPTETTIWSSILKLEKNQNITIGKPIGNTTMYILGKDLEVMPIGIIGELHIGGSGLARGYNTAEQTAKKFIPHPFREGERIYKTGDLACWLPDGSIEYLGRIDHQLKIRGYRIEAGEIENLLIQHPAIQQAAVLAVGTDEHKELAAYYVPRKSLPTAKRVRTNAVPGKQGLKLSLLNWGDTSMGTTTGNPYTLLMKAAVFADENGFEGIWIPERHFDPWGGQFPSPSVLAGAVASVTQNIKIRSGSVVAPLHHPVRIAENWSVVDNLSNGRVQLSFATGWAKNDFILKPENYDNRRQIVFDYLDTVEKLWEGGKVDFPDPEGKEIPIEIYPKPVQEKLPVFITVAGNPKSAIAAGEKGKFLLTHLLGKDWADVRNLVDLYRKAWKDAGHPGEGYVVVMVHTFMGESSESVREMVEQPLTKYLKNSAKLTQKNSADGELDEQVAKRVLKAAFNRYYNEVGLFGSVDHCMDVVKEMLGTGMDEIACLIDFGIDSETVIEHLPYLEEFNKRIVALTSTTEPAKEEPAEDISPKQAITTPITADLRAYLKESLPPYMIPSVFMKLEEMPLTPSGKINRKVLPKPDMNAIVASVAYIAPRNPIETTLVDLWQTILEKEKIGIQDDFFDLGGHSLRAIRLASLIQQQLKVTVSLVDIFSNPTIVALGALVIEKDPILFQRIEPVPLQATYELSNAQRRLWVLDRLDKVKTAYNELIPVRIKGSLDKRALEKTFNALVARHEILRTNFILEETSPRQIIRPIEPFSVVFNKWEANTETGLSNYIHAYANQIFDLENGALLKVELLEITEEEHILLVTMHHIITDGWSIGLLLKELNTIYESITTGKKPLPTPLDIQYKDYSAWQNNLLSDNGKIAELGDYWKGKLADPTTLELPADYPRPAEKSYKGATTYHTFNPLLLEQIETLGRANGATLFMVLTSLLKVLLYRYSGQTDIIIGTPSAGRNHPDLYNQLGFYLNILVLRDELEGTDSFTDTLAKIKQTSFEAFEGELYPFDQLVEELQLDRDRSRSPLFDVLLVHNNEQEELHLGEAAASLIPIDLEVSKYDLIFNFSTSTAGLELNIVYNTDVFKKDRMERLVLHLETLIESAVLDPTQAISKLNILPQPEQQLVLHGFNNTTADFPKDKTLMDLFEEQVRKTPDNIAVIFGDTQLSYRQLNEKANQLGHYLRENHNIQPDDIIALQLERSEWMLVAIFGVMKAGAAYLPIASDTPKNRVAFILQDSRAKTLLTDTATFDIANQFDTPAENVETIKYETISWQPPIDSRQSSNLAYIIYTSGSTGQPKGVMIEHQGIVNRLTWMQKAYPIGSGDCILQKTPYTFDVSVWELLWWSSQGATVAVLEPGAEKEPARIIEAIEKYGVTTMHFVPSMLNAFLAYLQQFPINGETYRLKQVFASGEALGAEQIRQFFQLIGNEKTALHNLYGPTEASIDVSYYDCRELETAIVPIGKPIDNIQLLILDKNKDLVPIGVGGELCISGTGLARGYLNNPALTAEKFMPHPFRAGERLYRTGDLACWLPDGNIEFLGRIDHQLKIRGYRIEAGEIEQVLLGHPAIESTVVIGYDIEENKELVAYVVPKKTVPLPAIADLRSFLGEALPNYMIPAYFVELEDMPLTSSGKVNRKVLPTPDTTTAVSSVEYVAPRTTTEATLVDIWEAVLQRDGIGIHDNFFDIGGHSLRAVRFVAFVQQRLAAKVALSEVFDYPTIAELATIIERKEEDVFMSIPSIE